MLTDESGCKANILDTDIRAANGVIHAIEQVELVKYERLSRY